MTRIHENNPTTKVQRNVTGRKQDDAKEETWGRKGGGVCSGSDTRMVWGRGGIGVCCCDRVWGVGGCSNEMMGGGGMMAAGGGESTATAGGSGGKGGG